MIVLHLLPGLLLPVALRCLREPQATQCLEIRRESLLLPEALEGNILPLLPVLPLPEALKGNIFLLFVFYGILKCFEASKCEIRLKRKCPNQKAF